MPWRGRSLVLSEEVLEPEEVRMQIKKMINKMAEKYII